MTTTQPMSTAAREVIRCRHCQLVQYRTHNDQCRRCSHDLVPPPSLELPGGELEVNVSIAIRSLRRKQGLTQKELAERMQVPRTYVSKIENHKAQPTLASLERLAAAMNTDVGTILCCSDGAPAAASMRALIDDGFMRQLLPYLPRLQPPQMKNLLLQCRHMMRSIPLGAQI